MEWWCCQGQGPAAKVEGRKPSLRIGGIPPPTLAQQGGHRAPTFRERQEDCGAAWAAGPANVGFMSRGGTDRGLCRVSPGEICLGSFLGQRPETTLRFWARVLFVCLFGFGCCFPTLTQYLGVNQIIKKGLWRFGTPAGAVGALWADKAAHLHRRAAGGLTAAAAGQIIYCDRAGRSLLPRCGRRRDRRQSHPRVVQPGATAARAPQRSPSRPRRGGRGRT